MTLARLTRSPRILVIDDEPRLRDVLTQAIAGWGFEAIGARSAEEATRLLASESFEILVLDLNLPGQSGLAFFEELRRTNESTQVIVLTGYGDLEAARSALRMQAADFLTKPARLADLEQAISAALKRLPVRIESPTAKPAESPAPSPDKPATIYELSRDHILATLKRFDGNRTASAASLGISLRTLHYRLAEYQQQGIEIE